MGVQCNLDIYAGLPAYTLLRSPVILLRMAEKNLEQPPNVGDAVEYQKGCPLCDHSDPDLERELVAWAQLLWDHFSSKRKNAAAVNIDNAQQSPTLRERSNHKPTPQQ